MMKINLITHSIFSFIKGILVILAVVFSFSTNLLADTNPLIIDNSFQNLSPGKNMFYLKDQPGKLSLQNIQTAEYDGKWIKAERDRIGFGFTKSSYWVRFELANTGEQAIDIRLEQKYPLIDELDLYVISKDESREFKTGDMRPFRSRPLDTRTFVFPLKIPAKSSITCYLRYKTSGVMTIELSLWSSDSFQKYLITDSIILWIIIGGMLMMIIYNFFQLVALRDIIYIFSMMYIAIFTIMLLSINGLSFQYLWPDSIWWANCNIQVFIFLFIIIVILYMRNFVHLKDISRIADRIVLSIVLASGILLTIMLATGDLYFGYLTAVALGLIMIGITQAISWYFIFKPGHWTRLFKLIHISFAPFTLGFIIYIGKMYGVLPSSVLTDNALKIAGLLNVIILAVSISDKINTYQTELKDLNLHLEDKIVERTEELSVMNKKLVNTNKSLESAHNIARRDMDMAVNVQMSIFPKTAPRTDEWDIAFYFKPLSGVSGDMYDFYLTDNVLKGILMMDVSGHGIASGLLTMIARSVFFKNFTNGTHETLGSIIEKSNEELIEEIGNTDKYLSGIMLRFNRNSVEYVNAGHPDILINKSGEVGMVRPEKEKFNGTFLGIRIMAGEYTPMSFNVEKNDVILMHTDCLTESNNEQDSYYTDEMVMQSFARAPQKSAESILQHILSDFYTFLGDAVPTDDLTIIVAKRLR